MPQTASYRQPLSLCSLTCTAYKQFFTVHSVNIFRGSFTNYHIPNIIEATLQLKDMSQHQWRIAWPLHCAQLQEHNTKCEAALFNLSSHHKPQTSLVLRRQGGGKGAATFLKSVLRRTAQEHGHALLPAWCVILGSGFFLQAMCRKILELCMAFHRVVASMESRVLCEGSQEQKLPKREKQGCI